VNFARLQRSDAVALVAAFALLLVMAMDWYSTVAAENARRTEEITEPSGAAGGEVGRAIDTRAREAAEEGERNAWQADGAIDRVILVVLLAAYALAVLSAFLRAAGRRVTPPLTPAALGAGTGALGGALVAYRIWQEPGLDAATTIQSGAPLAIIVLAILSLALATAYRGEESGAAWKRIELVDAAAAKPPTAEPPPAAPTA
jgi:hypothetical protein